MIKSINKNLIIKSAIILTLANIITRVLGFIYRVYMSKLIGAAGMGLIELIIPIYILVWSISSAGFSTTLSKVVAEENAKGQSGNVRRILRICMFMSFIISTLLSIIVYVFSSNIASDFLNEERLRLPLAIMSIAFPFMAVGSCIRGYFLGMQNALVPAISQVLEQICRMTIVYILGSIFIPMGILYACVVAIIGMCLGEIFSFLYVYMVYNAKVNTTKKPSMSTLKCYKIILIMAIPLGANRIFGSFLAMIENILIPKKLVEYGYTALESISLYGELNGMIMPLILFPSSILIALATSMIPAISEAHSRNNDTIIKQTITKSFLFTSIIAFGALSIFVLFPYEIGDILYNQKNIGLNLLYIGLICPLLYFHITLSGILNGLGKQMLIFVSGVLSSIINISFLYFLIPIYGFVAFIWGWGISLLIVNLIAIISLRKYLNFSNCILHTILKPLLCAVFTALISNIIYNRIYLYFNLTIAITIICLIFGAIYLFLLICLDCIKIPYIKDRR